MLRFLKSKCLLVAAASILLLSSQACGDEGRLNQNYDMAGATSGLFYGGAAGEGFGQIIRTGDVNGDGTADLVAATQTGKIHVWLGGTFLGSILDAAGGLPGAAGNPPDFSITGYAELRALGVRDITGDGCAEIVIGFTPISGSTNVAIIKGRTSFPRITFNIKTASAQGGATTLISTGLPDDGLAADGALTFGNLNGDSLTDLILGAPDADADEENPNCGKVFIIFGSPTLFQGMNIGQPPGTTWAGAVINGASANDRITQGGALHVSDLNGDGIDDLVIGSSAADGPGESCGSAGEAYIVLGRNTLSSGSVLHLKTPSATHGAAATIYGPSTGARLTEGSRFTSGDVNGDGIKDLLLSAPMAAVQPASFGAGKVFVVFGRPTFPLTIDSAFADNGGPASGVSMIIHGAASGNHLTQGGSLAAADVNGDGIDDILCGSHEAPNTMVASGDASGQLYIILGRKAPAQLPGDLHLQLNTSTGADITIHGGQPGHHLGRSGALLTGDLDGDGIADIIVGSDAAAASGTSTKPGAGRAYVIAGRSVFPANINLRNENDFMSGITSHVRGASAGDGLTTGGGLALADISEDGDLDLILGAPGADGPGESRPDAGEIYVVRGKRRSVIKVLGPAGQPVTHGSTVNLGKAALGGTEPFIFTVKNTGRGDLLVYQEAVYDGPDAFDFFTVGLTGSPQISPGVTKTFPMTLRHKTLGVKKTRFVIRHNDLSSNNGSMIFNLEAEIVRPVAALVKTLPPLPDVTSAILKGQVDSKGFARRVYFDYGPTKSYGKTVEVEPVSADFVGLKPVQTTLSNLQPHTRYYFRVRTTSNLGNVDGAALTFLTGNRIPIANNDEVFVTNSSSVTLPLFSNDTDGDGDPLSIATFTQPKAGGKPIGKLTKAGSSLVFTAPLNFTAHPELQTTFTYSVKDAFGGTSAPATVVLEPGEAILGSPEEIVLSDGDVYFVYVSTGSLWSLQESSPWITTSIVDSFAKITVLPNPAKTTRQAALTIAGKPHVVTQTGVVKPIIALPSWDVTTARVSSFYSLPVTVDNSPAVLSVTSLPPGLKIDQITHEISGFPTRAGTYPVTITARNAAGQADQVLFFDLVVGALDPAFVGAHVGLLSATELAPGMRSARLEFTTTLTGTVTGKIFTGLTTYPFTSRLSGPEAADGLAYMEATIVPADKLPRVLSLTFDPATSDFSGTMTSTIFADVPVTGWKTVWTSANQVPSEARGLHTFAAQPLYPWVDSPAGYPTGSFTLQAKSGAVTVSGRLPDGSPLLTSSFIGKQGQILIFQPLYANKGQFAGAFRVDLATGSSLTSMPGFEPAWYDPGSPPSAKDTLYPGGFGPVPYAVFGGRYPAPAAGELLLGTETAYLSVPNASLTFGTGASQDLRISNITPKGFTHKLTPTGPVLNKFTLPVFNALTGAFSGEYTEVGESAALARRIVFQGLVVRANGTTEGYGSFILTGPPETVGQPISTIQRLSYSIKLVPK